MSRPAPLSGFPEWLPAERLVELSVLDTVRRIFELHGFSSLETRAVEPLEQMLRKGEIDKEVYVLRRLHADESEGDAGLGLHFDLTVPFARYVLQNAGQLEFPFRRYQVQKVWRGERPQEGRFREFTQADIDIVGRDTLSFHHEVEVALVMAEVFRTLPCPPAVILVNNRKLAEGFFLGLGASDAGAALRAIDKLDKIGPDRVADLLASEAGLSADAARACLRLAAIRSADTSFVDEVRSLGVEHPLLEEGLAELAAVVGAAHERVPGAVVADLKIARGLDYYTGTVYETQLVGYESVGSVCSGGRYDALASDGRTTYPGVGISLGVTRLLAVLVGRGLVTASRAVPTCVLVAVTDEASRRASEDVAAALRGRGISTEVAPAADRFGKQIRYADRRGIPFVWFPDAEGGHAVKDIRSGDQVPADPASWRPPQEDLVPAVRLTAPHEQETTP
ncbi:MAG TPA: histidine--tRNA ligase [Candidatus Angelobacter sp.]|nr:histidine--tRNA ligase [Candidatus Angelobacter sp.]